jgi:DNA-binding XRE family transcriptional regulator
MTATPRAQKLDISHHDRRRTRRLVEDDEFRAEYERQRRTIASVDAVISQLDSLRAARSLSKAELARAIGRNPASVRRLLTARGNPELGFVIALADVLDADVVVVRRDKAA